MRIIKSGKKKVPRSIAVACKECDCLFMLAKTEAKFVADPRDGDAYVVKCPECESDTWIDAKLF